ncbi:hypothetical protein LJR220_000586 [Bradyrhizobium sp. LjRoot220]|uniref:hypothetical protein n=1 Tax=Bradyrhizobium sp. LjRoot220 TaxID=3342284 RepID=UPI003ECED649
MTRVYAARFQLKRAHVVFLLCACVVLTATAEARSGEIRTQQSIPGGDHHVDPGGLLYHGNYCGLGSRPGTRPVDVLDAACMRHDACGRFDALPSCACNARLQYEAAAIARNPAEPPEIQFLASFTAAGAGLLLCQPPSPVYQDSISRSARGNRPANGFWATDSYRATEPHVESAGST